MKTSRSSSIEHSERRPPYNHGLAKNRMCAQPSSFHGDKLKLGTHDTLCYDNTPCTENKDICVMACELQSPDPAGLFSEKLIPLVTPIPHNSTPAVDTHRSDADVWNLNQLHKANNCNNCLHFFAGKCDVHKYQVPYKEIECEQWEYRGKKA